MQRLFPFFIIFLLGVLRTWGAGLSFTESSHEAIAVTPDRQSGLENVYVVYSTQGVSASYSSQSAQVSVARFSMLGGGYAEDIPVHRVGNTVSFALGTDDMGYIISDGTSQHCFWVTNYANHFCELASLTPSDEQDCERTALHFSGNASAIAYYGVNGRAWHLDRKLRLAYFNLVFDDEAACYRQEQVTETLEYIDSTVRVPSILCDTSFRLEGDCFLEQWGEGQSIESGYIAAYAVAAHTTATMVERENDNEQKVDAGSLGGSAPVDITFTAQVTDAAIFTEWQMTRDPEFEQIDDRFRQTEFSYTFRDNGTTYVRFVCANAEGTCEFIGDTYEVFVGESTLICPNAFSPGASEGVNDEWKVSYKSIIDFECHIFNRWGKEMISFTDPGMGWDGKYGGKVVPSGVYFYVIRATGSDGKKYNLKGHINIVGQSSSILPGEAGDTPVEPTPEGE